MADFARVLSAVDEVLGTDGLARYLDRQGALAVESLTGDLFVAALLETVEGTHLGTFIGTAAELLKRVTPEEEKWRAPKGWPADPRAVTQRLRRQAPVMRKAGWLIEDDNGANHRNVVIWTITPPSRPEMAGNPGSPASHGSREDATASHASHASHGYRPSQDDDPAESDRS